MKFSVIIPAYNCETSVGRAIESILNQSYDDFEILIADDGSTDNTRAIIDGYSDPRIIRFHQDINRGNILTRNLLTDQATGDFITIQDADDWSEPGRLQHYVEMFSNLDIKACATASITHRYELIESNTEEPNMLTVENYDGSLPFMPATICVKHEVYQKIGGLNPYFNRLYAEDHYWCYLILERFGIYYSGIPLYHYVFRPESLTRQLDNSRKLVARDLVNYLIDQRRETGYDDLEESRLDKLEALEKKLMRDARRVSELYRTRAAIQADLGEFGEAKKYIKEALKLNPWSLNNWRTRYYIYRKSKKAGK